MVTLLSRVEALTGPDRLIDDELAAIAGISPPFGRTFPITGSVDAALAFAEKVLPGYDYILEHTNGGLTISCLMGTADPDKRTFGAALPLAIILAVLRAKEGT